MVGETRKRTELARREKEILERATALFNGDNWPSVTMDQIAAAADVSKGTLYNHFASKDDIYARLLIDFSVAVLAELNQLDHASPPDDAVKRILGVFWDAYRTNRQFLRIAYNCEREGFRAALSPGLRARLEELDLQFLSFVSAVIQRGIKGKVFRKAPIDRLLIGPQLVMAGMSRFLWTSGAAAAAKDPRFKALCEFVLAGLRE